MKCYSPFSSNQYGEDEYKVIFRNILKKDYVIDDKLNIINEGIEIIHKLLQQKIMMKEFLFLKCLFLKNLKILKKKNEEKKKKEVEDN